MNTAQARPCCSVLNGGRTPQQRPAHGPPAFLHGPRLFETAQFRTALCGVVRIIEEGSPHFTGKRRKAPCPRRGRAAALRIPRKVYSIIPCGGPFSPRSQCPPLYSTVGRRTPCPAAVCKHFKWNSPNHDSVAAVTLWQSPPGRSPRPPGLIPPWRKIGS